jgi:hypothetical protein
LLFLQTWPCRDYPDDGKVTFYDIAAECDNKDCTDAIQWSSEVKDPNCDMKANIISSKSISITWDTSKASKYDNHTRAELFAMNAHGWAKNFPMLTGKK